ncbi:hypothetical protein [Streptomyces sp. NPDC058872]|uniref:hypothetical protein n=1 Tax=Streptomyces sp. NPDC058872 TaxID=3346661 RepID=UPI00368F713F
MLTHRKTSAAPTLAPAPAPAAVALALAALLLAACSPGTDSRGTGEQTASPGTALAAVDALTVRGRAPKTGYERDEFGSPWADVDGNGCSTRVISMARAVMELFSQRKWGVVGCA